MDSGLEGRAALVAGAGRGIGRACALELAAGGAAVMCLDSNAGRATAVAEEIRAAGGRADAVTGSVLSRDAVRNAVDRTTAVFGRFDICVDIIGESLPFRPFTEFDDDDWQYSLDINLRHVFLLVQEGVRAMRAHGNGGSVVLIGSVAGLHASPGFSLYAASKAAMVSLVQTLSVELGPLGIRVNVVAPGATRTPRTAYMDEPGRIEQINAAIPLGRRGDAEEQACAVAFLASDRASYITGETLVVDGGGTHQGGRSTEGQSVFGTSQRRPADA